MEQHLHCSVKWALLWMIAKYHVFIVYSSEVGVNLLFTIIFVAFVQQFPIL